MLWCVCLGFHLVANLLDGLHPEVLHRDPFGIFADPPPLWDLVDPEGLPPFPAAGQTAALHNGLHLDTGHTPEKSPLNIPQGNGTLHTESRKVSGCALVTVHWGVVMDRDVNSLCWQVVSLSGTRSASSSPHRSVCRSHRHCRCLHTEQTHPHKCELEASAQIKCNYLIWEHTSRCCSSSRSASSFSLRYWISISCSLKSHTREMWIFGCPKISF